MDETELQRGDRVIVLAVVVRNASLFAGVAAGGLAGWLSQHKAGISAVAALGGGVVGFIIGMIMSRIIFPATSGNVVIAKVGMSSLALTLKGGITCAVIVSVLVSVLVSFLLENPITMGLWPSFAAGIIAGFLFLCFSSLL